MKHDPMPHFEIAYDVIRPVVHGSQMAVCWKCRRVPERCRCKKGEREEKVRILRRDLPVLTAKPTHYTFTCEKCGDIYYVPIGVKYECSCQAAPSAPPAPPAPPAPVIAIRVEGETFRFTEFPSNWRGNASETKAKNGIRVMSDNSAEWFEGTKALYVPGRRTHDDNPIPHRPEIIAALREYCAARGAELRVEGVPTVIEWRFADLVFETTPRNESGQVTILKPPYQCPCWIDATYKACDLVSAGWTEQPRAAGVRDERRSDRRDGGHA